MAKRAQKLLLAALAGVLLVTTVVCAFGLYLTVAWYRNAQGLLLQAEERAARARARELEAIVAAEEMRSLDVLSAGAADSIDGRAINGNEVDGALGATSPEFAKLRDHPFLRDPFYIRRDGAVVAPQLDRAGAQAPRIDTEVAPPEFEQAWRRSLDTAESVTTRVADLEAVDREAPLSSRWRIRIRLRVAALQREAGDADAAIRTYRSILADHAGELPRLSAPSVVAIRLALLETLAGAGRPELAAELAAAVETLASGSLQPSLEDESFFLERSERLARAGGVAVPARLEELRRRAARRRMMLTEAENLRDRLLALPEPPAPEGPQRFVARVGSRVVPTTWRSVSSGDIVAAGFQIDPEGLCVALRRELGPGVQLDRLRIERAGETQIEEFVTLATLAGDLGFVSIGATRADWSRVVASSRRPFLLAGLLISLLGVIVLIAAFVLIRGLRREFHLSKMKTEFVAAVSHELKTPLALIRLCGETLLLRRVKDEKQSDRYLEIVTRESVRLGHLIANMLNFSSIEAGKKTYTRRRCDLAPIVRETIDNYRFHLEEKGFSHTVDVPASSPAVLADSEAIAQALINLLQNAVLYSQNEKQIDVRLEVEAQHIRIAVADRGMGIAPEDQPRIWEDYFRTGAARAKERGSGLGLSLVRHIMNSHDGWVDLTSAPGHGSTFTLVFPIAPRSPEVSGDD